MWQSLQTEPSALWHANLDGDPHIYHYTFGLEFTTDGLPVTTIGDWSLDKRHYMSAYPPRQLEMPPRCAGKAALTLTTLFNEATGNITDWPTAPVGSTANAGVKGTKGWGEASGGQVISSLGGKPGKGIAPLSEATYKRSRLAQAIATRGPWKWGGEGPVVFYRGGRLYTPWGSGRWSLAGEAIAVQLGTCGQYRLVFNEARTAFSASTGRGVPPSSYGRLDPTFNGKVAAPAGRGGADGDDESDADEDEGDAVEAVTARWRTGLHEDRIYQRLLGSGPWSWQGVSPVAFLGGGVLHTPWGPGTWSPHPTRGVDTIYANFVGEKHAVTFDDCWAFRSVRDRDGDRADGVAKIDGPPKACPTFGK